MPQLGETVAEGTVSAWHKQVGDRVEQDELLLDVETDKVATEIPAPAAGVLAAIHVSAGETVDVGTLLAVIQPDGEAVQTTPQQAEPPGQPSQRRPESTAAGDASVKPAGKAEAPPLSPAVRRLLVEHQLDAAQITGTGRQGRIKRSDVLAYLETGAGSGPGKPVASIERAESFIPFDRLRRVTAEHMVRSKATSPHVLQALEVDFSKVVQARSAHATEWKAGHGFSLTYLPFIAAAVCRALQEYPRLNASVRGEGLVIHPHINLAIAVDLNHEGLVAPVIRSAEQFSITELAGRISASARQAREGSLRPDDLNGGTYTLSNSGSFGTLITAPIINQPQVAILSVDAVKKRPVVVSGPEGDAIGIRPVGILAQSFDHRAIDGAYSAAFLQRLQSIIEQTDWEQELGDYPG
ncbi:MAG: dihydrolipoamide acetyltransferase family protein [Gammaproteobacteria bacterium]